MQRTSIFLSVFIISISSKCQRRDCSLICSVLIVLHDLAVCIVDSVMVLNKLVVSVLMFVQKYFNICLGENI